MLCVWKREKKNEQQLLIERDCCGAACIRLQESADSCREIFMAVETTHVHTHTHTLMNTQQDYCLGSKLESGSTKEVLQRPAKSANCFKDASPSFYMCSYTREAPDCNIMTMYRRYFSQHMYIVHYRIFYIIMCSLFGRYCRTLYIIMQNSRYLITNIHYSVLLGGDWMILCHVCTQCVMEMGMLRHLGVLKIHSNGHVHRGH